MPVSPDDRFAGLISASAERGGWVPGDVFGSDSEGEDEVVEPRRVRVPVLVALVLAAVAVLVLAFLIFRPAAQHGASDEQAGSANGDGARAAPASPAETQSDAGPQPGPQQSEAEDTSSGQSTPSGKVVVHVTGQVHAPSVVTLAAGARVQDAVEAAGGLKAQADTEAVNLARVLQDGEQIHIPEVGEQPEAGPADSGTGTGTDAGTDAGSGADAGGPIDLNSADVTALQTLPGVGPVTAEAIIAHRETQPFTSVEDLLLVQGIGPKTYDRLKDLVSVS